MEDFKKLIDEMDEQMILSVAQNFLSIEQIKKLLLDLDQETKDEIIENFCE